jgi:hypothetical protein
MKTQMVTAAIFMAALCIPEPGFLRAVELDLFSSDAVLTPKVALRERFRERPARDAANTGNTIRVTTSTNLMITARLRTPFPLVVTPDTAFSLSAGDFFFDATFEEARLFDPERRIAVFRLADDSASKPGRSVGRIVVRWDREKLRISLSARAVPGPSAELFSESGPGTFVAPATIAVSIGDVGDERILALVAAQGILEKVIDGRIEKLRDVRITGTLDRVPPQLTLSQRSVSQTTEEFFDITGTVRDLSSVVVDVFLNGELAEGEIFPEEDPETGEHIFVAESLALEPGRNRIRVVARDENGNGTSGQVTVEFIPEGETELAR